ncbi:MAG: YcxB family protein [Nitrospira sp. CG24E]|nr:MAG: YcxB family protein [Nitrospira sp. CG24E]
MPHEATLIYSESLLRQAVFAFWRRSVGLGFILMLVVLAAILVGIIALGASLWLIVTLAVILAIAAGIAVALYVGYYRNSLRKFRTMEKPQATFCADESSFTMSSDAGTTTLQWSAVKELWQFPSVWLLLYSKTQYSTLPLACLPPETQAFVQERVREAGGKVAG